MTAFEVGDYFLNSGPQYNVFDVTQLADCPKNGIVMVFLKRSVRTLRPLGTNANSARFFFVGETFAFVFLL